MKFITVLFFTIIFASGTVAIADDASSRKSLEKLMELTEVSKMMGSMKGQMGNMFNGMSKQMGISEKIDRNSKIICFKDNR